MFKDEHNLSKEINENNNHKILYERRLKELKDNINKFTLRETKASLELNLPEKNYKELK